MKQTLSFSAYGVLSAVLLNLAASSVAFAEPGSNNTGTVAGRNGPIDTFPSHESLAPGQKVFCQAAVDTLMPTLWEATREKFWATKHRRESLASSYRLLSKKILETRRFIENDKELRPLVSRYRKILMQEGPSSPIKQDAMKVVFRQITSVVRSRMNADDATRAAAGFRKVDCPGLMSWDTGVDLLCKTAADSDRHVTHYGWNIDAQEVEGQELDLVFHAADDPLKVDEDRSVLSFISLSGVLETPEELFSAEALMDRQLKQEESIPKALRKAVFDELSYECRTEITGTSIELWAQSELDKASAERAEPSTGNGGAPAMDPNAGAGGVSGK